jgi:hypothetical protein
MVPAIPETKEQYRKKTKQSNVLAGGSRVTLLGRNVFVSGFEDWCEMLIDR